MSKVLVTGARGLVGSNLTDRLTRSGHEVFDTPYHLLDTDAVNEQLMEQQPDIVFHLAANAAESRGQVSPIDMTANNIGIFVSVLRAAINAKVKRFIYTSSVAVYGEATVPYKEDGETIPKDVYGVNKLACEQILKIMAKVYNFEYVILRPHNIYGPGQNMSDPYRNVVALFMRKIIEGDKLTLYGNGQMRRSFSFVDDVVDVLAESLTKFTNQTVNVGSAKDISIGELAHKLVRITNKQPLLEMVPARKQEISMFLADHTLQNSLVEYKETPIEEGLKKTWDWVVSRDLPEIKKKEDEIVSSQS